jgi:Skp family chaperone for outer membrane proteins
MLVILAGAGTNAGSRLAAQQPCQPRQEQSKEAPVTKIAFVNLKVVFEKYDRAQAMQEELITAARPYQQHAKKLRDHIKVIEEELARKQVQMPRALRDQYEDAIRKDRNQLEDLTIEFTRQFNRKHKDLFIVLQKEVLMSVKAVAESRGFHAVLPYSEPSFPVPTLEVCDTQKSEPNAKGAPIYLHSSVDITDTVILTLTEKPLRKIEQKQGPGDQR